MSDIATVITNAIIVPARDNKSPDRIKTVISFRNRREGNINNICSLDGLLAYVELDVLDIRKDNNRIEIYSIEVKSRKSRNIPESTILQMIKQDLLLKILVLEGLHVRFENGCTPLINEPFMGYIETKVAYLPGYTEEQIKEEISKSYSSIENLRRESQLFSHTIIYRNKYGFYIDIMMRFSKDTQHYEKIFIPYKDVSLFEYIILKNYKEIARMMLYGSNQKNSGKRDLPAMRLSDILEVFRMLYLKSFSRL